MNDSGRHRDRPPPTGRSLKRKATPSSSSSGSSSSSSEEEKSASHTSGKRVKGAWPAEPRQDSGRSEFYGERPPPHPSHHHNYDRNNSNSASASSGSSNYYNQEEPPSYDQQQQHQQNIYQERQETPSYDQQQRHENRPQEHQEPPSYDQQQHRQQNRYQERQEPPHDQQRHQSRFQGPSHDQQRQQQQRHHSRYQETPSAYNHHQRNRHQEPSSAYHHRYQDRPYNSQNNSTAAPGGLAPVVARHYNAIEEKGLEAREDSMIVILRKYNNWAKSMNFNDAMDKLRQAGSRYNELVGLDFCCGKGGDLRKWEKSRMMKHVVFVDIAEVSLANCKERYEEIFRKSEEIRERRGGRGAPFFTAEFIVLDCTKDSLRSKLSDPNMEFDLVSCQFSFHYSFESYLQAKQMLTNATENLKRGGYFIGTTVNADRMVKRRRQCGGAEFGNEVYHVRFECDEPYQTYGARYFFKLQDAISCPEFLVHFPTLIQLASGFNLKLVYKHPFEKFHEIHSARHEAKGLLNQMGALECYPPTSAEALRFDEKQYAHASRFIESTRARNPDWDDIKVGTISAVEWEAIRLYIAFCFQKV